MGKGKRTVKWTSRALKEKMKIMEYWFRKNKSTDFPIKLEKLFSKSTKLLASQPEIGIDFSEIAKIKFKTIGGYRLYYTFDDFEIVIITIWDTRRNPDKFSL